MITVINDISHKHNPWLVVVAGLLCTTGSWVTTRLFQRSAHTVGMQRYGWLSMTALSAGVAIWCTHFVAILGYDAHKSVEFEPVLTFASLLIAMIGSTVGFILASSGMTRFTPALGGAVVGLSIAAMHYTGMIAYRVQGIVSWDMSYLVASITLSIVLSALALHLAMRPGPRSNLRMASILSLAIICLHFIGMTAFRVQLSNVDAALIDTQTPQALAIAITVMSFIIVGTGLISFLLDEDLRAQTNRREAEHNRVLQQELEFTNAILNSLPEIFYHIDINGRFLRWNKNHAAVTGYSAEEYEQLHVMDLFPEDERAGIARAIDEVFEKGESARQADFMPKDGRRIPYLLTGVNLQHGNTPSFVGIGIDITERKRAEDRIRQLAEFDTLTGLPNRHTFSEQLAAQLAIPGSHTGLLYIDLDGFKLINDTRGHQVGDRLLQQVASRLRVKCEIHHAMAARLGGDEFVILLPHDDAEQAMTLAQRVIQVLGTPYDLDYDRSIQIGASVGIALAPLHAANAGDLLARADIALYVAKSVGKSTARLFLPDMEARIHERTRTEEALRTALDNAEELFVFYQPIVDIHTGRVTAREALVRWHHPARGWISPAEFVPVAEQSGLIDPLGLFVLNRACQEAAGWTDDARVAVNISAIQLGKGTIAPLVRTALDAAALSPARLEIEVTETVLLQDETDVVGDLQKVRALGVRVALDDFGTGYSSLSHLRIFPFDKIKIDGSFVREATDRPECAAIVQTIAELGRHLGVSTVAEGVETQAQLDLVRKSGCKEVQGYLYGRPVPSDSDATRIEALSKSQSKNIAT